MFVHEGLIEVLVCVTWFAQFLQNIPENIFLRCFGVTTTKALEMPNVSIRSTPFDMAFQPKMLTEITSGYEEQLKGSL